MNKRGVFVTLSAIIILAIVVFLVIISQESAQEINEVNLQYSKHKVMADHIDNMEKIYMPVLVRSSAKHALAEISRLKDADPGLDIDIEENVSYAVMANNSVLDENYTLTYYINTTFSTLSQPLEFTQLEFDVLSIRHTDPWTLELESRLTYTVKSTTLSAGDTANVTWSNTADYVSRISVIGLTSTDYGDVITGKWYANSTATCILGQVDGSMVCPVDGLCPLAGC